MRRFVGRVTGLDNDVCMYPWLDNTTIEIEGSDNRCVSLLMHDVCMYVYRSIGWWVSFLPRDRRRLLGE